MKLAELAAELGVDLFDAFDILARRTDLFDAHAEQEQSLYSTVIPQHRLEHARSVILDSRAQQVIEHVKEQKNTPGSSQS